MPSHLSVIPLNGEGHVSQSSCLRRYSPLCLRFSLEIRPPVQHALGGSALCTLFTLVGIIMQVDLVTLAVIHPLLIFIYLRLLITRLMAITVTLVAALALGSLAFLLLQRFKLFPETQQGWGIVFFLQFLHPLSHSEPKLIIPSGNC